MMHHDFGKFVMPNYFLTQWAMGAFGEVSKVSMDTSVFVGPIRSRTLLEGRKAGEKKNPVVKGSAMTSSA